MTSPGKPENLRVYSGLLKGRRRELMLAFITSSIACTGFPSGLADKEADERGHEQPAWRGQAAMAPFVEVFDGIEDLQRAKYGSIEEVMSAVDRFSGRRAVRRDRFDLDYCSNPDSLDRLERASVYILLEHSRNGMKTFQYGGSGTIIKSADGRANRILTAAHNINPSHLDASGLRSAQGRGELSYVVLDCTSQLVTRAEIEMVGMDGKSDGAGFSPSRDIEDRSQLADIATIRPTAQSMSGLPPDYQERGLPLATGLPDNLIIAADGGDLFFNGGASGSPMVNLNMEVVGVLSQSYADVASERGRVREVTGPFMRRALGDDASLSIGGMREADIMRNNIGAFIPASIGAVRESLGYSDQIRLVSAPFSYLTAGFPNGNFHRSQGKAIPIESIRFGETSLWSGDPHSDDDRSRIPWRELIAGLQAETEGGGITPSQQELPVLISARKIYQTEGSVPFDPFAMDPEITNAPELWFGP